MRSIGFDKLKEKLAGEAQRDKKMRELIAGLVDVSQLKEISRSPQGVVLTAVNKTFAQELFFKKEALQDALACPIKIR